MSAKEMFETLGFIYDEDETKIEIYKLLESGCRIYMCIFYMTEKNQYRLKMFKNYVSVEFIQAINKQLEELGWLNENDI